MHISHGDSRTFILRRRVVCHAMCQWGSTRSSSCVTGTLVLGTLSGILSFLSPLSLLCEDLNSPVLPALQGVARGSLGKGRFSKALGGTI